MGQRLKMGLQALQRSTTACGGLGTPGDGTQPDSILSMGETRMWVAQHSLIRVFVFNKHMGKLEQLTGTSPTVPEMA